MALWCLNAISYSFKIKKMNAHMVMVMGQSLLGVTLKAPSFITHNAYAATQKLFK